MESSTSMASNAISKILECPICFQEMSQPKMLPCQHTFCFKCTQKVATGNHVTCTLCQRKEEADDIGSEIVSGEDHQITKTNVASNSISEILECPICFQEMSEPKMLPCQHTFCLQCTQKVTQKVDTKNLQVQCALCQRKHQLPVNGAIGLPNNSTLVALLEMTSSFKVNLVISEANLEMETKKIPRILTDDRYRIRMIKNDPRGALIQFCLFKFGKYPK